jgi:hypothetical protein
MLAMGKTKMDKKVRERELQCVRHSRSLHRERVVQSAVPKLMEKKLIKKQRRRKRISEEVIFCGQNRKLKNIGTEKSCAKSEP